MSVLSSTTRNVKGSSAGKAIGWSRTLGYAQRNGNVENRINEGNYKIHFWILIALKENCLKLK